MCRNKLIVWISLTVVYITCHLVVAIYLGKPWQLSLPQFVTLTTSTFTVISGGSIIHQIITSQQLLQQLTKLLSDDSIITLFVGAATVIWVSIQEILRP